MASSKEPYAIFINTLPVKDTNSLVHVYRAYKADNPGTVVGLERKGWMNTHITGSRETCKKIASARNGQRIRELQDDIAFLQAKTDTLRKASK